MLFSGLTFLFYFLPVLLIIYAAVPGRFKNIVLLLGSFFFYAWGEPRYLLLMLFTILIGYMYGRVFVKIKSAKARKTLLTGTILLLLVLLGYFKYADFVLRTISRISGHEMPILAIALPIGISFYTFQTISYVVDVYRGEVEPQKDPIIVATYIAMFPQLIAGPIVRYAAIERELGGRTYSVSEIAKGIRRFVIGLSKKVLIANSLGQLADAYRAGEENSVLYAWMFAFAITLQLYYDFSGYSDMAIGLGKILGFSFPENFNYPFTARSVTDFWRRWHMTLGSWFRDYLYIPLGGNRVSALRHIWNIGIVWMATGLWHGAGWNFVLWGLFFAVFLVLEKKLLLPVLTRDSMISRIFSHIYLILVVGISFLIFEYADPADAVTVIRSMFGAGALPVVSGAAVFQLKNYGVLLLIAMIGSTPYPAKLAGALFDSLSGEGKSPGGVLFCTLAETLTLMVLFAVCTAYLVSGSFNPFLYFRF